MSTVIKIRILLVVLTCCFFITAIMIRLTFNNNEILLHDARKIESNLQAKEAIIAEFLKDEDHVNLLLSVHQESRPWAENLITHFTGEHNIYVFTYLEDQLLFWSSEKYVPFASAGVVGLNNTIRTDNGWYQSIRFEREEYTILFLIPIKSAFQKDNSYLKNEFSKDLIRTGNLDIADYRDRLVYNIRSSNGQYLFSVKLNDTLYESLYSDLELIMWVLGTLFVLILAHIFCLVLARRGWSWLSILIFASVLVVLKLLDLDLSWFSTNFDVGLFDPRNYASSALFPHLGAFLINIIFLSWFVGYIYTIRERLWIPSFFYSPVGGFVLVFFFGGILFFFSNFLSVIFSNLISNSDINFDVTDILNLSFYSWIGIFGLCLSTMSLSLCASFMLYVLTKVIPSVKRMLVLQLLAIVVLFVALMLLKQISYFYMLAAGMILFVTWYSRSYKKYDFVIVLSSLLVLASIVALKHSEFQRNKKREAQKLAIQKLEAVDDANALALFFDLEKEIIRDSTIVRYFMATRNRERDLLIEHLKTVYFSGYLSKYDFSVDGYDERLSPIGQSSRTKLSTFRDRVISGAIKVSENFYRGSSSFGNFEYFAQFPVYFDEEFLGVLLIDMKSRSFSQYTSYPEVLADSRLDQQQTELISDYSYAFYRDGQLVNQSGKYVYPVTDSAYDPIALREFKQVGVDEGFSHLAYKSNSRNLIVLSKPEQSNWMQLASLSFFFLVFMLFYMIASLITWLVRTLSKSDFSLRNLRWNYLIMSNRTLYSTRIQMFIVVAVVFTLITVGVITYYSISQQFSRQQETTIMRHAWEVAKGLESRILKYNIDLSDGFAEEFEEIAESNALDLNLFDVSGRLVYSTQPRIYDLKLISEYMNPVAFQHMSHYGRSQYVHEEEIGDLNYIAGYAAIKNADYAPIAYLSVPYFSSQREFDNNIGGLFNTLINIYALVILVLGLFAVFVANKVTAPLLLVQKSLAKTKIGKQNEPIFWKRNDEIGSLIREYNLMIAELEQSALKIMQSERESAWKEMAKQVAHEIKNPLTPLKLGMQQLERSWKDGDPNFDARFVRFKESFIEQIDSLSRIASEFSDFAKMPDTKILDLDLMDVIDNSVSVFDHYQNVTITVNLLFEEDALVVNGDKDQLLRTFNNLIKNAIEAAVNKRRCQIQIYVSRQENHALIEFRDNGEGISIEARKKLFQPNFTTKSSGTGLGLAFVKRALENMGGSIHYKTAIGKGTTFFIRIPLQKT